MFRTRFNMCSTDVKCVLFKTYCLCFYNTAFVIIIIIIIIIIGVFWTQDALILFAQIVDSGSEFFSEVVLDRLIDPFRIYQVCFRKLSHWMLLLLHLVMSSKVSRL